MLNPLTSNKSTNSLQTIVAKVETEVQQPSDTVQTYISKYL